MFRVRGTSFAGGDIIARSGFAVEIPQDSRFISDLGSAATATSGSRSHCNKWLTASGAQERLLNIAAHKSNYEEWTCVGNWEW
jgi:hypothetical protein